MIPDITQATLFDYASLDSDTRAFVEELDTEYDSVLKRTAKDLGHIFLKAKAGLPHGLYMSWLSSKRVSQPTAWRCMQVAQGKEVKSFIMNDLEVEVIEPPVEPVEEVQECVTLRTPREVVEQFFADFPNSEHLSNREIAKRCGATEGTVRNYKKELFPEPAPEPEPTPDPEPIQTLVESTAPVENIPTPELPKLPKIELLEDIRQAREIKREQQRERNEQLKAKGVELPPDQYACLVIDPPWKMEKIDRDLYPNQVDFDYPTMDEEELKAFPLPDIAADDCHLYLWTTQKHLPLALRLVEHWGFKYQCLLTWVKNVGFTPFSWMYTTEHVLFCTKGNLPLLRQGMRLDFSAKRREHSRKPDEFYDIVREVSPEPRIDVFSREKRDGFKQYGNEVDKYV